MLLPRHSTKLSIPLLALPLSCTGEGQNDEVADGSTETGDGDGDGDGGACTAPGTTVPDIDPFVPADSVPDPTCSTGWASDAPLQDAKWVATIPDDSNAYYYSIPPVVKGLSGGAALLLSDTTLQWFDGQGTPGAAIEHGLPVIRSEAVYVREADDHVFIAGPVADDVVILEFVDGAMVSELMVPTPGENTRVAGLYPFSTDEWLIVGDEFDPMESTNEVFFMRVDGLGNQVLRKATSPGYSYYYYYSATVNYVGLDAEDNLLFGSNSRQWLVDPNEGTVINGSVGLTGMRAFVGSKLGSGFVWAGLQNTTSLDGTVNGINGFGVGQWTRSYDRALTGEFFFDLAARPGGGYVAAGLDGIWWQPQPFQAGNQPLVVAFSEQGDAEWIGRLAIPGDARSVDVAADGGVVAAGRAQTGGTSYDDIDSFFWVASW